MDSALVLPQIRIPPYRVVCDCSPCSIDTLDSSKISGIQMPEYLQNHFRRESCCRVNGRGLFPRLIVRHHLDIAVKVLARSVGAAV